MWLLYRTKASLRVDTGELIRTDALGRVTKIPLARVSCGVRQTVRLGRSRVRSPQLLFLAADDRCLLRVYASQYDTAQLSSLCAAAGVPLVGSWDDLATSKEVRRHYPGSYSWWLAHPWAFGWIISIVAIVVGVAIATR
jgi:hypothetical protein